MDKTIKPAYDGCGTFHDMTKDAQKRSQVEYYRQMNGLRLYNSMPNLATLQIRGVTPLTTGLGQRPREERVLYANVTLDRNNILELMAALDHALQDMK